MMPVLDVRPQVSSRPYFAEAAAARLAVSQSPLASLASLPRSAAPRADQTATPGPLAQAPDAVSFADEFTAQWIPLLARRVMNGRSPSLQDAQRFLVWAARDLVATSTAWQALRARLELVGTDMRFADEAQRCIMARDAEQAALAESLQTLERAFEGRGSVAATRALVCYQESRRAWDAFVESLKPLAARVPDVTWLVYGPLDTEERCAA